MKKNSLKAKEVDILNHAVFFSLYMYSAGAIKLSKKDVHNLKKLAVAYDLQRTVLKNRFLLSVLNNALGRTNDYK